MKATLSDGLESRPYPNDAALLVWCWLLSGLVFLTVAQSKLPSYCVFLFIPVALIAGVTADSLLSFGFRGKGERVFVITVAAVQCAAPFVLPMMKVAKPFAVPALLLGACLAVGFALLLARKFAGWIAASSLGVMAMIFTAVTFTNEHVEELTSVRPVAMRVAQLQKTDEPVLASKFLVRGIYYNNTRDGGGTILGGASAAGGRLEKRRTHTIPRAASERALRDAKIRMEQSGKKSHLQRPGRLRANRRQRDRSRARGAAREVIYGNRDRILF
jgi:hypothetical protein